MGNYKLFSRSRVIPDPKILCCNLPLAWLFIGLGAKPTVNKFFARKFVKTMGFSFGRKHTCMPHTNECPTFFITEKVWKLRYTDYWHSTFTVPMLWNTRAQRFAKTHSATARCVGRYRASCDYLIIIILVFMGARIRFQSFIAPQWKENIWKSIFIFINFTVEETSFSSIRLSIVCKRCENMIL